MPLPLIAAGVGLGLKGLASLFKHKGQQSAGKEQYRAGKEKFGQSERSRIWRNQASQALLRTLFGGRYAVPEDTFSNIQTERPYTGPDPTKGAGWGFAGDTAGAVGNAALDYSFLKGGPFGGRPSGPGVGGSGGVGIGAGGPGYAMSPNTTQGGAGVPLGYPAPPDDWEE